MHYSAGSNIKKTLVLPILLSPRIIQPLYMYYAPACRYIVPIEDAVLFELTYITPRPNNLSLVCLYLSFIFPFYYLEKKIPVWPKKKCPDNKK